MVYATLVQKLKFMSRPILKTTDTCVSFFSLIKRFSSSSATNLISLEVSKSEAKHWSCDLEQYINRFRSIKKLHFLLKDSVWSSETENKLKTLHIVFDVEVVCQVLRTRGIPSATRIGLFYWLKDNVSFLHNFQTYDALIGMLRECGQTNAMVKIIDDYQLMFPTHDSLYFHNLLRWNVKYNNLVKALAVWDQMRECGVRPSVGSCNLMMDLFGSQMHYQKMVSIYHQMVHTHGARNYCQATNNCTYTILIKHLSSAGHLNCGIDIFDILPLLKLRQTALMFAILISESVSAGNDDLVKDLCLKSKVVRVKPTKNVLLYMQQLMKQGKVNEASIIGCCFWPELTDYQRNQLYFFSGYSHHEDDESVSYHRSNEDESICLDNGSSLQQHEDVDSCVNIPSLAHAIKRLKPNTESRLASIEIEWTAQMVYKVLCHIHVADTAWKFFNWVEHQPGYVNTAPVLSRMIALLAVNKNMVAVELLFEKAKKEDIPISVHAMNATIKAYGMLKNCDQAAKTFNRIKEFGSKPNVEAYENVIHATVKQGNCLKALRYFDDMQMSGFIPTCKVYVMLIECYGLAGDLGTASFLFGKFIKDMSLYMKYGSDVYTAMIKACFWNKKPDIALKTFDDCKKMGMEITGECIDTLTKGLCLLNRKKEAKSIRIKYMAESSQKKFLNYFELLMKIDHILESSLVGKHAESNTQLQVGES